MNTYKIEAGYKDYEDLKLQYGEKRIIQLEKALEYAIEELREWNADSESADELEEILKDK